MYFKGLLCEHFKWPLLRRNKRFREGVIHLVCVHEGEGVNQDSTPYEQGGGGSHV